MIRPRRAAGLGLVFRLRHVAGLGLVEMLVVLLAVALLAALALPRYNEHLRRSRRAEARLALMRAAHWLEGVATETGRYPVDAVDAANAADPAALPQRLRSVPSGAYRIGFAPTGTKGSGYTLTAQPQGAQAADRCGAYTLTHTGLQGLAAPGAAPHLVAECWNR